MSKYREKFDYESVVKNKEDNSTHSSSSYIYTLDKKLIQSTQVVVLQ